MYLFSLGKPLATSIWVVIHDGPPPLKVAVYSAKSTGAESLPTTMFLGLPIVTASALV